MALAVLGPVRLDGPDSPVVVEGRKPRQVLTLLALAAPRPLSVDVLAHHLWDEPPPAATKIVQAHLSRLRTALAAADPPVGAVVGGPAGYQLVADPMAVDVEVVADLRRRARLCALAGEDAAAESLLRQARARWRGEPELPATAAGDGERERLAEERLALVEDHLDATILAGRPADAAAELAGFASTHPLRERAWELRIRALYLAGRQAEALDAYRAVRRHLRTEVGVEPGPALQAVHAAVLTQTVRVQAPAPPSRPLQAGAEMRVDGPHYAEVDGSHVAYATFGTGPDPLLVLSPTFIPLDAWLEEPRIAAALGALAAGRRLLAYDRRGLGLSDPVTAAAPPTLSSWVADAVGVLDATGTSAVDVFANADTSMVALRLAAAYPDRVRTLTLVNGYPRFTSDAGYPHGLSTEAMGRILRGIHTPGEDAPVDVVAWRLPSAGGDPRFRAWWDAVGRRGASPRTAALVHRLIVESDVRAALPQVRCPVLLLSRLGCASYDPGHGRYLARHLPDARLREREDPNDAWFVGDVGWLVAELDAFLRGVPVA